MLRTRTASTCDQGTLGSITMLVIVEPLGGYKWSYRRSLCNITGSHVMDPLGSLQGSTRDLAYEGSI
jgi:hypothetical protein